MVGPNSIKCKTSVNKCDISNLKENKRNKKNILNKSVINLDNTNCTTRKIALSNTAKTLTTSFSKSPVYSHFYTQEI